MIENKWVLVTGGSHGIGLAMAEECLRRSYRVAVVALDDENLALLRERYRENKQIATLGLDLTAPEAITSLISWLEGNRIELSYLINNAGFGRGGLIEHTPWREYATMLELNNRVMAELCYRLLPMLKTSRGGIMNMSSMEATMPLPYKTVYTGTKAFVYNFSLALREELRYHGVGVTVLCPGPVITNEDGMKRMRAQGWRAKLLVKLPEDIAPVAIDGMLKDKDVIRPGWLVKFLIGLSYVIPRQQRMSILEKLFSRYREDAVVSDSLSVQSLEAASES